VSALLVVGESAPGARLGEWLSVNQTGPLERIDALTRHFTASGADLHTAAARALQVLDLTVRREALVAAYGDAFILLGVVLLAAVPLVLFIGRERRGSVTRNVEVGHARIKEGRTPVRPGA